MRSGLDACGVLVRAQREIARGRRDCAREKVKKQTRCPILRARAHALLRRIDCATAGIAGARIEGQRLRVVVVFGMMQASLHDASALALL